MHGTAAGIWAKACEQLAQKLSKDVYERWIATIQPAEARAGDLRLRVANDFYQSWLEENYLPLIAEAVAAAAGRPMKITFLVDPASSVRLPEPAPAARRASPKTAPRRQEGSGLNPKFTFDTFVVGPNNNFAHAAALAVAQSPARAYNPLFIYGGVGLGKTHLMQAIGHYLLAHSRARVSYLSSEAFLNEYIEALRHQAVVDFRRKYRSVDALLIDDIHFLAGKEGLQEEFFHTFNALFESQKQIVLTSDRPASEIAGLEQRLVSRFEWGLVTELEPPDIETRLAILRAKQAQLQVAISDDVLLFLAQRIRANIRRLEGALIRCASYASLTGRPLQPENLEGLLRDLLDEEVQSTLTVETIQRVVAEYFDIRLGDMTGRARPQAVAFPRQVAMYLCRTLTSQSLPAIGQAFGRNHATVLHACRVVSDRLARDPDLRSAVAAIRRKLGQPA